MKILFSLLITSALVDTVFAQTDEKFAYQQVQQKCSGMPLEKRARVSVTRFNVTTSTDDAATQQNANANNTLKALGTIFNGGNSPQADKIPATLGENLTSTLTNALQGINCFRVLESLKNKEDLNGEIDEGNSGYSNKKTAPKAGKQLGPQIVVTGEIIEYSVKEKGLRVIGVGGSKKLVKMGFIVKMVNPETRDLIDSKTFRVESKSGSSFSAGIFSTNESDPAIAAVLNDGVIKAVEFMAHIRDSLDITVDNIFGNSNNKSNVNAEKTVEVVLTNANFDKYDAFTGILNSLTGVRDLDKSFSEGTGSYTLTYTGKLDAIFDEFKKKLGSKYEITGYSSDRIVLKAK